MKTKTKLLLARSAAFTLSGIAFLSSSSAQVTAGADFEVDAGADTDADSVWEDTIGTSGYEWYLDTTTNSSVSRVTASGSTNFTHAYDFPGGFAGSGEGGIGGAKLVVVGETGECRSFREVGYDNQDATLEFWIKPDTLTHTTTNGQVIWEDGGGTGYGLFINDNILYSDNDNGNDNQISYDLSLDPQGLLLGAPTTEFIQIVMTRVGSTGLEELFINGVSVGTATDGGGNWSGGDGTGLGARGDDNVGGQGNGDDGTESFDGQIALFRIYNQQILSPAEVFANFEANAGTPKPDFEVDASADADGDDRWEDQIDGNPSGVEFLLDDSPAVNRVVATGTSLAITHAYNFPGGGGETTQAGGLLVDTGTTIGRSTEFLGWDQQKVMVEIWFRPDNLTPSAGNGQILWETGGGSGLGFFIDDNKLIFSHDVLDADGIVEYNLSTDPNTLLLGAATTEFIQAIGSYDPSTGNMELFINGVSVATTTSVDASFNDWSGSDPSGLGTRGGSNAGGFGNGSPGFTSFDGEITRMRIYSGAILSTAEVLTSFQTQSAPDSTSPVVETLSPADDATGLYVATNLTIEFSEPVIFGASGTITIQETGGATFATYDVSVANPELSISGSTLTINPATNLSGGVDYHIEISSGAIADPFTNDFDGISLATTWNFQTAPADGTAPLVTLLSPLDNAINVSQSTDLVITLDDDLLPSTGDIRINEVGGSTLQTIDINDASQVSLAGGVLTINPTLNLPLGTEVAVQIDGTALVNFNDLAFAGISDDSTWSFTVESFPTPVAYWPMRDALPGSTFSGADDLIDDATHGAQDATPDAGGTHAWGADPTRGIVYVTPETSRLDAGTQDIDMDEGFTWSLWVKTDGNQDADSGADVIIGTRSGAFHKVQPTSVGGWVNISGYNIDDGEWHHVVLTGSNSPSTKVSIYIDGVEIGSDTTPSSNTLNVALEIGGASNFNEDIAGCISDVAIWRSALAPELITLLANDGVNLIEDLTAPVFAASSPADGDGAAEPTLPLQLIFDERVTIGSGDIRIINTTDNITTTIAVTDASQVTVSGAAITITPNPAILEPGKSYAVEMDAGVVVNASAGLSFGGILDQMTWNFTVAITLSYDEWVGKIFTNPFTDTLPTENPDNDSLNNFLEFGFGTDPTVSDSVSLVDDGTVNGLPIAKSSGGVGGIGFDLLFVRRNDHGDPGSVTYTAQFSHDMVTFFDSTVDPVKVANSTDDPDYEVVSVPYPPILPNGQKARFARVKVVQNPS